MPDHQPQILIIMGVSGAGKTTLGTALAKTLGAELIDADDFHPAANIEKMQQGLALNDQDREPWLRAIDQYCQQRLSLLSAQTTTGAGGKIIVACSALKQRYRQQLPQPHQLIYLQIDIDTATQRVRDRESHFMPAALVTSQFEDLEPPTDAIIINADRSQDECLADILSQLTSRSSV